MRKIPLLLMLILFTGCEQEHELLFTEPAVEAEACTIAYSPRYLPLEQDPSTYSSEELVDLLKQYEETLADVTLLYSNYRYQGFLEDIDLDISHIETAIDEIKSTLAHR